MNNSMPPPNDSPRDSEEDEKTYERYLKRKQELKRSEEVSKRVQPNTRSYKHITEPNQQKNFHDDFLEKLQKRLYDVQKQLTSERNRNSTLQATVDRMKGQLDGKMKGFEEVAAYKSALQQKTEQYMELEEKYRGVCIRNKMLEDVLQQQLNLVRALPTSDADDTASLYH